MWPTLFMPSGTAAPTDPYFGDVVLLLRGEGADASTTFVDHSSYGRTVTKNGGVQMDTDKSRNGRPSIKLTDALNDWLRVADAAEFALGSSDFTFECWLWWDSFPSNNGGLADAMANNQDYPESTWEIYFQSGGGIRFSGWSNAASSISVSTANNPATGQWVHFAVNRTGTLLRMYYDGVQKGSTTLSVGQTFNNGTEPLYIGGFKLYSRTLGLKGWISECRWTIGYGRYPSGGFTPPADDFPLA